MAVFSGKPSSTGDFCRQPRIILAAFRAGVVPVMVVEGRYFILV